jgi:hypothetical protein
MRFKIRQESSAVTTAIQKLGSRATNLSPALNEFAKYRRSRHFTTLNREVSPYDEPHAPLKPATIERKQKKGADLRILHETLRLRNSFEVQVRRKSMTWSYGAPYAKYHVSGTSRLPKRSPIEDERGLARRDATRLTRIVINHILDRGL